MRSTLKVFPVIVGAFGTVVLGTGTMATWSAARAAPDAPDAQLERVEKQLEQSREREKALGEKARKLAEEAAQLKRKLVDAAAAAQDSEEKISSLEADLAALNKREHQLKADLGSREEQMVRVLVAIERMALRPPEAVVVQPVPVDDVVRSAILLRTALPQLTDKARTLRNELAELAGVRIDIGRRRADVAAAAADLDDQRSRLNALVDEKSRLRSRTEAEQAAAAQKADALAKDAGSLRDLLAKLEEERKRREAEEAKRLAALAVAKPKPPGTAIAPGHKPGVAQTAALPAARPLEEMRGGLPMPARGGLLTRYGEPDGLGSTSKGIVITTRPAAQVVAPGDGTVAFAGPFRGYGQLLIIEHGGGYHMLLSGMNRIDAVVGQRLLSGEPVGVMDQSEQPALYIELRRDGQPINPLPWLTARKG